MLSNPTFAICQLVAHFFLKPCVTTVVQEFTFFLIFTYIVLFFPAVSTYYRYLFSVFSLQIAPLT